MIISVFCYELLPECLEHPALVSFHTRLIEGIDPKDLTGDITCDDPMVCEIMDRAMFYVGIALANIVSIINPHLILLSGAIFTNLHNAEVVQDSLMKHAFLADYESLRIVPLDMGEYAGAIGAAACCIEKYFVHG